MRDIIMAYLPTLKRLLLQAVLAITAILFLRGFYEVMDEMTTRWTNEERTGDLGDMLAGIEYLPLYFIYFMAVVPATLTFSVYLADRWAGYGGLYRQNLRLRHFLFSALNWWLLILAVCFVGLSLVPFQTSDLIRYYPANAGAGILSSGLCGCVLLASVCRQRQGKCNPAAYVFIGLWTLLCAVIQLDIYQRPDHNQVLIIWAAGFGILYVLADLRATVAAPIILAALAVLFAFFVYLPFVSLDYPIGKFRYRDKVVTHIEQHDTAAFQKDVADLISKMKVRDDMADWMLAAAVTELIRLERRDDLSYLLHRLKNETNRMPVWPEHTSIYDGRLFDVKDGRIVKLLVQYGLIDPAYFFPAASGSPSRGFLLNNMNDTAARTALIEAGADVNQQATLIDGDVDYSPLTFAISRQDTAQVAYLLCRGADADRPMGGQNSPHGTIRPLSYVQDAECARLLLRHGAKLHPGMPFMYDYRWDKDTKALLHH